MYSTVEDQVSFLAFYNLSEAKLVAKIRGAELLVANYFDEQSSKTYIHYIENENVVLRPIDLSCSQEKDCQVFAEDDPSIVKSAI